VTTSRCSRRGQKAGRRSHGFSRRESEGGGLCPGRGPIRSTYWWKGKVEEAEEWLLMMKTRRGLFSSLEKEIKALHPYEVPEIIALPIVAGSAPYLEWIQAETSGTSDK